jgi:hypothetical protein
MKKFRSRKKNALIFLDIVSHPCYSTPIRRSRAALLFPDDLGRVSVPRPGSKDDRDFFKLISKSKRKDISYLEHATQ